MVIKLSELALTAACPFFTSSTGNTLPHDIPSYYAQLVVVLYYKEAPVTGDNDTRNNGVVVQLLPHTPRTTVQQYNDGSC